MDFTSLIRTIPDYPKPGIQFRDITTLLKDASGFHAAIDSNKTRTEVFSLISTHEHRFDFTFLDKREALPSVSKKGEIYLYKLAFLSIPKGINEDDSPTVTRWTR